jgi:hypothetical protein
MDIHWLQKILPRSNFLAYFIHTHFPCQVHIDIHESSTFQQAHICTPLLPVPIPIKSSIRSEGNHPHIPI